MSGASVHTRDAKNRGVLHFAAQSGSPHVVRALLHYGASLGADGTTTVQHAIKEGDPDTALLLISVLVPVNCAVLMAVAADNQNPVYFNALLKAGVCVDDLDSQGYSALHRATQNGSLRAAELLLKHVTDKHQITTTHMTLLSLAVNYKSERLVKLFIDHGIKRECCNSHVTAQQFAASTGFLEGFRLLYDEKAFHYRRSCLLFAAEAGHLEIVREIFERDAHYTGDKYKKPESPLLTLAAEGQTGMHLAAANGHLAVVQEFVSRGLLVDTYDAQHETAFQAACKGRHLPIMHFLFNAGANCNLARKNGQTALFTAIAASHLEVVAALLKMGTRIETRVDGHTALQQAVASRGLLMVRLLLPSHPNLNAAAADGTVPVFTAVDGNEVEMLRLLIQSGASPNAMGAGGQTALCAAARKGSLDMVKILVEGGACVQLVAADGKSPLEVAATSKSLEIVDYLLQAGAGGIQTALAAAIQSFSHAIVVRLCQAAGCVLLPSAAIAVLKQNPAPQGDNLKSHRKTLATLLASGSTVALFGSS